MGICFMVEFQKDKLAVNLRRSSVILARRASTYNQAIAESCAILGVGIKRLRARPTKSFFKFFVCGFLAFSWGFEGISGVQSV
jgi:hypothetical protein